MKHYGDITKLNGWTLPPVDVVTGGSPCQDLSIAGKQAGLSGERSGLFMEQIRIVKELRERDVRAGRADRFVRPRYMVWENVPGAFSSNKGRDFQTVLTEIVRIAEPDSPDVPLPEKGGWPKAGCLYDDLGGWSIAWRLHDAQFWGVPQRRKRIALVADFGGLSAPEILFERKGMSRNPEPGEAQREEAAGGAGGGAAAAGRDGGVIPINDKATRYRGGGTTRHGDGAGNGLGIGKPGDPSPTLSTGDQHAVYDARGNGDGGTVPTITGDHGRRVSDYTALCVGNGQMQNISMLPVANTLDTMHDQQAVLVPDVSHALKAKENLQFREDSETYLVTAVDCRNMTENSDVNGTLQAKAEGGTNLNSNYVCRIGPVVRRLTPKECERLQGYPDGWTDLGDWTDSKGKKRKDADSPRYRALGNSIALPFWQFLARRICAMYEREITMGSLFDGIGGFPLAFERSGAKAVWASEIEEFPIAVTKARFPET